MGRTQPPGGIGSGPPTLLQQGDPGARGDAAPGELQWESDEHLREGAVSRQPTMDAALRKIDTLLKLNMALREEIDLLASAFAKAEHCAFCDELTGLPSERLVRNHFELAKSRADRKHSQVGLISLDLHGSRFDADPIDDFAVDRVLQQAADRLVSSIRRYDSACRYGHGGFVVLLPNLEEREQAIAAQCRISARLALPYKVDGTRVSIEARGGVAQYPLDGRDYAEMLKVADDARRRWPVGNSSPARRGAGTASRRHEWT